MALVTALFCVPLFVGLDSRDFDNDESIYSFSVDVMLKNGDWLTPKSIPSETSAFLEKPPLKFWMVGLPIHFGLLPANEFGMRFWDALMGSVGFLYIFAIGRRLAGPLCGFIAVLLLYGHGPLIAEHGLRTNNMESAIFLAYAAGIYHFLAWRSAGPDNRSHIVAIALYFVLGFMTKFVAAVFLPLVLAVAIVLTPADRYRLKLNWLTFVLAGLLAAALIAPWFVYEYFARGPRLFDIMFGAHVVKRFTAFLDPNHLHPWYWYFTELWRQLQLSGAGLLVLAGSALLLIRTVRSRWLEGALLVLWFAIPLGIISTGTSKLYHYAYPFLPPAAIAGGYFVSKLASALWQWMLRPAAVLASERDRISPSWIRTPPVRIALTVLGALALILALSTAMWGKVRIALGGTVLLRNSHAVRAFAAGVVTLVASAPAYLIRAIIPFGVLLAVVPWSSFGATLKETTRPAHAIRDVRDCLMPMADAMEAEGKPRPGVWVEGRSLSHITTYYLRGLGPWQERDVSSDATVAMNLYLPASYRPVLLSSGRSEEFLRNMETDRTAILTLAARKAEVELSTVIAALEHSAVAQVPVPGGVLLLPGTYQVCVPKPAEESSR